MNQATLDQKSINTIRFLAVEAGTRLGWEHYVGMDGFGASAPAPELYEKFGIAAEAAIAAARVLLDNRLLSTR